ERRTNPRFSNFTPGIEVIRVPGSSPPATTSIRGLFPIQDSCRGWFRGCQRVFLLPGGSTRLVISDARLQTPAYVAGELPGHVWDLRTAGVAVEEDAGLYDRLSLAVVGKANPDGTLHGPGDAHTDLRDVIWFGCLVRPPGSANGRYALPRVINLAAYYNLGPEVSLQAPPQNGKDDEGPAVSQDWCLTSSAIVFAAKDPRLPGPAHTASVCYVCQIFDWTGLTPHDYRAIAHHGLGGAITSPTADRNGAIAFLSQEQDGYAADKNRIIWIDDPDGRRYREIFASPDGQGGWDPSPSSISFAGDGTLLVLVEEKGQRALYQLDPIPYPHEPTPADLRRVDQTHYSKWSSVVDVSPVVVGEKKPSRVLITYDSFVHSRRSMLLDLPASGGRGVRNLFIDDLRADLSNDQVEQIWFLTPSGGSSHSKREIHAWVIKPSHFTPEQQYPLLYCIHSAIHGSWTSTWQGSSSSSSHTTAAAFPNLALLAEQGYVVVAPNITGSIGYGADFVNGTRRSFAGAPYADLEAGFAYLEAGDALPYVDTARAVALGGPGYGGFLVNWIQGQPLGRKFRALVSWEGVLDVMSYLAAGDEQHLQSVLHEMGGPPWRGAALEEWKQWDPAMHLGNWATPHGAEDEGGRDGVFEAGDRKRETFLRLHETVLAWLERFTG
ncbi:Alpha/Beta hydrolase protein, partial [Aspergillus germanicus]